MAIPPTNAFVGILAIRFMKTLQDYYEQRKKEAHAWPNMHYNFSKPRYREPMDTKEQETLSKYIKQVYNPRIKKMMEVDYFKEEWLEPELAAKT